MSTIFQLRRDVHRIYIHTRIKATVAHTNLTYQNVIAFNPDSRVCTVHNAHAHTVGSAIVSKHFEIVSIDKHAIERESRM